MYDSPNDLQRGMWEMWGFFDINVFILYRDIYKTLFYTPTLPTLPQMIKYKENKNDLRHS